MNYEAKEAEARQAQDIDLSPEHCLNESERINWKDQRGFGTVPLNKDIQERDEKFK